MELIYYKADNSLLGMDLLELEYCDLVAGVYEGGLKVWECTVDLLSYLQEHTYSLKN